MSDHQEGNSQTTVPCTDPMERAIADALSGMGIQFEREKDGLDFYLPGCGIYIEVKQFHSARIAEQMSRADNIIVAQGRKAVELLADMIEAGKSA